MSDDKKNDQKLKDEPKQEQKPQTAEERMEERIAAAIKAAIPQTMLALEAMRQATAPKAANRYRVNDKCGSCGQQTSVCNGEHVLLECFPRTTVPWPHLNPGSRINGVRYISREGERVLVPKVLVHQIIGDLERWAVMERELPTGKKRTHQSGAIGPSAASMGQTYIPVY
jgi:hypothetical protein